MRLIDAGYREQEWARRLVADGELPRGVTFEDFLNHGTYEPSRDEVRLTFGGVLHFWKVERP